jgi:hypothetical protein
LSLSSPPPTCRLITLENVPPPPSFPMQNSICLTTL